MELVDILDFPEKMNSGEERWEQVFPFQRLIYSLACCFGLDASTVLEPTSEENNFRVHNINLLVTICSG